MSSTQHNVLVKFEDLPLKCCECWSTSRFGRFRVVVNGCSEHLERLECILHAPDGSLWRVQVLYKFDFAAFDGSAEQAG